MSVSSSSVNVFSRPIDYKTCKGFQVMNMPPAAPKSLSISDAEFTNSVGAIVSALEQAKGFRGVFKRDAAIEAARKVCEDLSAEFKGEATFVIEAGGLSENKYFEAEYAYYLVITGMSSGRSTPTSACTRSSSPRSPVPLAYAKGERARKVKAADVEDVAETIAAAVEKTESEDVQV